MQKVQKLYQGKMDSSAKKIKLSKDELIQNVNSLSKICENLMMSNNAIEYHDFNDIKKITYEELETTKMEVKEILDRLSGSQFVAIDLEVPSFCIPSLILGIILSGRGFINISSSTSQELCSRLKVLYLLSKSAIPDTQLLYRLNIHGQSILLLKFKTSQDHSHFDFKKNRFAYAISTSGTTGVPKIVRVPHESIVPNILDLKHIFLLTNEDKIAQLTTLIFDPSIVEIFLGLSSNCTLFMASDKLKNNPRKLLEIMTLSKVTIFQTTPSLLFGKFSKTDLKDSILSKESCLRILILGGEPFPKIETLLSIRHEKNQTRIFNIYGITEVSCWASVEEFHEEKILDICNGFLGKTFSQTLFEVRNEEGKQVEEGEGILFIGSKKRICLIDEEIDFSTIPIFRNTGDKVMIDSTRRIFYKGRHNKIIKRFGNRVDLNKLENTILKMHSIQNCQAIWDEKSRKLHVCVSKEITFEANDEIIKSYIMDHLKDLPNFYRPDEIHLIDRFPLNSNGKICLQSLKKICIENTNCQKCSFQSTENFFQTLWRLSAGSLKSGFLKSGGTSVAALQMINSLSEKFNIEFPELIGMLLKDATFCKCLTYIENQIKKSIIKIEDKQNSETEMEILASGSNDQTLINQKIKTENIINFDKKLIDNCIWQKCRGFTSAEYKLKDLTKISIKKGIKFQFLKSFDLKKCVDASPTVFQCSSGKLFTTVGSHSGVISTVEINSDLNIAENYFVELPDRIEASVLVFDQFHGVVGCYDGNVYCLNLKTGEILWKFQTGDAVKCTAAMCFEKNYIFVGSYDRHMYCLSSKTGSEVWRMKASEGSISATARLHYETRTLLFGTLDGTCVTLDQVSGKIKWRNFFSDPIFAAPAILETGNVVFASVSGKFTCFNIQTGQKVWTYDINGNIFSHLVVAKSPESSSESIIFSSRNKTLYHLKCDSKPTLKYSITTRSPIIATPWYEDEIILIACIDGTLQIVDSSSGEILSSYKLSGDVFSSPVLHKEFIVVGCRDNKLYILKLIN